MKEIKTKDKSKSIRTLDRSANVAERMKNAYVRTKEQAEQTKQNNANSPTGYAEERTVESTQGLTRKVGHELQYQGKHHAEKSRQKYKERHVRENTLELEHPTAREESPMVKMQHQKTSSKASVPSHIPYESYPHSYNIPGRSIMRESAYRRAERSSLIFTGKGSRYGIKRAERGVNKGVRASQKSIATSARGTVRTAKRSVKTAEQTSLATIKTTQATAKKVMKTAQTKAKAAKRTARAAKATAKVTAVIAKTVARTVATTVKAVFTAVKGLTVVAAAGGWVAVVVIVLILLAAYILCSVFGIFASQESYSDMPSMAEVVNRIEAEFSEEIDAIIQDHPHDRLVNDNVDYSAVVANWDEVLAIYAVLVSTDPENPTEVATLDDAKIRKLKTVFWDMNHISYSLDEVEVGRDEETGAPITETVLTITVIDKTAEDMILCYSFSAERAEQVRKLLQPEYAELFQSLTGR